MAGAQPLWGSSAARGEAHGQTGEWAAQRSPVGLDGGSGEGGRGQTVERRRSAAL